MLAVLCRVHILRWQSCKLATKIPLGTSQGFTSVPMFFTAAEHPGD